MAPVTLNRMERHQLRVVFLAMCRARGSAWTLSVLRPLRGERDVRDIQVGDISDRALLQIVQGWGGGDQTAGVLAHSQIDRVAHDDINDRLPGGPRARAAIQDCVQRWQLQRSPGA